MLRGRARLPRVSDAAPADGAPLITVLVPARNEARAIGPCLASLARQTHPALEVIVIDDASVDATPAIVADAVRRHAAIRSLRVEGPPPGWTGKAFALTSGLALARGEWLCFTDADTVHAPESIARALGFAVRRDLDLLSMTSRQLTGSPWERAVQPLVFGLLDQWFPLDEVNDPASPRAAANGIFILVRRSAYDDAGGHRAVAGHVLEDVALARRVKGRGARIAFADGSDLVAARMYTGLATLRHGWVKNLYALCGRRPLVALGTVLELLATVAAPPATLALALIGGWPALAGAAALASAGILGAEAAFRARRDEDWRGALTAPLGAVLVAAFLLESTARDWLGLGVWWKDRRYNRGRGREPGS